VAHPNGCIPTAESHCIRRAACGASVCQRTKSTRRYPPILPASPGGSRGSHGSRPQRTIAGRTPQTACAEGTAAGRKVKPSEQFVVNGSTACRAQLYRLKGSGSTVVSMRRGVLPLSRRAVRRGPRPLPASGPATDRPTRRHPTPCALCLALVAPDGSGHQPTCAGLHA
jgi:hypothetical protein